MQPLAPHKHNPLALATYDKGKNGHDTNYNQIYGALNEMGEYLASLSSRVIEHDKALQQPKGKEEEGTLASSESTNQMPDTSVLERKIEDFEKILNARQNLTFANSLKSLTNFVVYTLSVGLALDFLSNDLQKTTVFLNQTKDFITNCQPEEILNRIIANPATPYVLGGLVLLLVIYTCKRIYDNYISSAKVKTN